MINIETHFFLEARHVDLRPRQKSVRDSLIRPTMMPFRPCPTSSELRPDGTLGWYADLTLPLDCI